jgi:hypothetical protein
VESVGSVHGTVGSEAAWWRDDLVGNVAERTND